MNANPMKAVWVIKRVDGGWRAVLKINRIEVLTSDPHGLKDDVRKLIARAKRMAPNALVHEED